jgi:poly(A) polymerase
MGQRPPPGPRPAEPGAGQPQLPDGSDGGAATGEGSVRALHGRVAGEASGPGGEALAPGAQTMNQRIAPHELAQLRREAARRRRRSSELPPRVGAWDPPWRVLPTVHGVDLDDGRIDPNAAKVVRRLLRHKHEAYLVGGCVRDLLLGRSPKDFDVATSACPDDVRALFRNSRIIGRRFRLVHVLFGGGRVIETATFRRAPHEHPANNGSGLLIRRDNVFGEAHEDAERRDFTINALFYDLERKRVLDWVGGMPDIERRAIHTIGDPVVRFQEDPVRILRAIRFSARLDLAIMPDVYDAMVLCRGALAMAARPRLFEELLRLLRGGAAQRALWLAWETGAIDVLLPELGAFLADADRGAPVVWRLLAEIDRRNARDGSPDDVVLWAALLLEPLREVCSGVRDRDAVAHEFLEPLVDRLNVPRRIADAVRRIVTVLPRLESGRPRRFARTPLYPLAAEVLELSRRAHGSAQAPIAAPRARLSRRRTRAS